MFSENIMSLVRDNATPVQLPKIDMCFEEEYQALPSSIQKKYTYDFNHRYYYLENDEWLKWRKHGPYYDDPSNPEYIEYTIGGSDVAVLYGGSELEGIMPCYYEGQHGSTYKCALQLFHEKLGIVPDLLYVQNNDYVLWNGHNFEEPIAQMALRKMKLENPEHDIYMWNDTHMYRCGQKNPDGTLKYPFALGDLDRRITIDGVDGVMEVKSCNFSSPDYVLWKQGICPLKYRLQVLYYLAIMNLPYAYIVCAWGLGENDVTYIYIERDLDIEDTLMGMVASFIEGVKTNSAPQVEGQDYEQLVMYMRRISGAYDESKAPIVKLPQNLLNPVLALSDLCEKENSIKSKLEEIKNQKAEILAKYILPAYGNSKYGTIDISAKQGAKVILPAPQKRASLDQERIKDELPGLYQQSLVLKFDTTKFRSEYKKAKRKDPSLCDISEYNAKDELSDTKCSQVRIEFFDR